MSASLPARLRQAARVLPAAAALVMAACQSQDQFPAYDCGEEMNAFFPAYNKEVLARIRRDITDLEKQLADPPADPATREDLEAELTRQRARLDNPEFFTFATIGDLAANLDWENNPDDPEIGTPEAVKGGTFNDFLPGFTWPPTIRVWGTDSNNSFRGDHYDNIDILPVGLHPITGNLIPGLAEAWAVGEDGRTVFYRLDPDAAYSDGESVRSEDFFMSFFIQLSPYLSNAYSKDYYANEFENITRYDERHFSIRLARVKPKAALWTAIPPAPLHFYREFGPDFESRFQWRPRITTGAYQILESGIQKGRSITLSRVKDWWARDKKYYRHRFNPDQITYRLVRTNDKAFELFKKHRIDVFFMNAPPKLWYERTEAPEFFNGYIEKVRFYNDYPRVPRGLYINHAKPLLDDLDIRIGLQHATNFQKVIDFDLRGDPKRMNLMAEGYGRFSHPDIRAREFDPALAREAFARAGFTEQGPDGILRRPDGTRLSFSLSYIRDQITDQISQRLKEEAVRAGLEYRLNPADGTTHYQHVMQKKHDLTYWGWGITPPYPDYYQHFLSEFAFESDGKTPKPMTNNISSYASPEMDRLVRAVRDARTEEDILINSHRIEEIVHEEAIWIPGFTYDYYRLAHWRWVRFPPDTFNVPIARDPLETHLHWIDTGMKEETLEAMRRGKSFPEVERTYDQYRVGG